MTDIVRPVDDARIATALQRGADGALAVVYNNYAPQLYDYCLTFFTDPEVAADALHEAMLVAASWAPHLNHREQLRLWLYGLTRNECLRKLRRSDSASILATGSKRPVAAPKGRTDPVLREVNDLVNRHGFTAADVALVLGIAPRRARALVARSASVLSRDRRAGGGIGRQERPRLPRELRDRVLASAAMPSRVAYRGELAKPRLRSGFPVPLGHAGTQWNPRLVVKVAVAFTFIAGLASAVAVPTLSRHSVLGLMRATSPISAPSGEKHSSGGQSGELPNSPTSKPSTPGTPVPSWEPAPLPRPEPGGSIPPLPVQPAPKQGQITGLAAKCVDVRSSATADGTPINLFPCNATTAQDWLVAPDGTLRAFGKCMGAPGNSQGAAVLLFSCTGSLAQQWNPQIDGTLIHVQSGRCLEVPGAKTENFTVLTLGTCTGSPNQIWHLPG